MQDFSRKLLTEWRKLNLPFSGKNILVAVSGGADSAALAFSIADLYKRKKLQNKFTIAHFNHKLRGIESKKDAEFVRGFAETLDFDFICRNAKKNEIADKGNLEQTARNLRYEFLYKTAIKKDAYAILTAHTINDQAETFLLNLIRGSGIAGLSAMNVSRRLFEQNEVLLVRPLLNWAKRKSIEKFCQQNKIEFRKDSMNDDINYKRVYIRKELIPMLENLNPQIVENLANSANLLREEKDLLDELLAKDIEFIDLTDSLFLEVKKLQRLSTAMLYKVLQKWLCDKRGDLRSLELKHFMAIKNLIHSRKSGKIVELPNFEKVIKAEGKLSFHKIEVEK